MRSRRRRNHNSPRRSRRRHAGAIEFGTARPAESRRSRDGTPLSVLTDGNGGFRFSQIPVGSRLLIVRAFGFTPESVSIAFTGRETITRNVTMHASTAPRRNRRARIAANGRDESHGAREAAERG